MNVSNRSPLLLAIVLALAGTACGEQARDTAQKIADETRKGIAEATAPGGEVDQALAEARKKLHEENLPLGRDGQHPKAELTPAGDLLIGGTAVPMTTGQREAALAYRAKVLEIADAGMVIGQQGAALGGEAAALAIESLFKGHAEEATARIEAEAKKIETAARSLCREVEGLEAAQTRFATLVPEFAPYAKNIELTADCDPETGRDTADTTATTDTIGT